MLHTKPRDIFNYFQRTAYSDLIIFSYYTLQTKNFIRVYEKLKIAHVGSLFYEECKPKVVVWPPHKKGKGAKKQSSRVGLFLRFTNGMTTGYNWTDLSRQIRVNGFINQILTISCSVRFSSYGLAKVNGLRIRNGSIKCHEIQRLWS